ncbi:hypothetical protein [Alteribacillus sp. HJP-4]|uniref:hypothetical protein n=1 Tax=Alteribacillus sp. HJP-4 TaxID=2775394 RepID=UPI0035CCF2D9
MKIYILLASIFLAVFSGMGIFIYYSNNPPGEPSEDKMIEIQHEVETYLIKEKGYQEEEILSLDAEFNPKFSGTHAAYSVVVVFSDEKDMKYRYGINNNEIYQKGINGSKDNPKHAEQ